MRVIEKNILIVFEERKNTFIPTRDVSLSMRDLVECTSEKAIYRLWGYPIFMYNKKENYFSFCFCNWSSNTTKSRLNALLNYYNLGGFYQKNYVIYWTYKDKTLEIDTSKSYKLIKDNTGNVTIR